MFDVDAHIIPRCWSDFKAALRTSPSDAISSLFHTVGNVAVVVGMCYRRLVFYVEQPKFDMVSAFGPYVSSARTEERVHALRETRARCEQYVDEQFTRVWLDRCSQVISKKRVGPSLRLMIATTPIAAVAVDANHILGQEVRRPRARGKPAGPEELSKRTYLQLLGIGNQRRSEALLRALRGENTKREVFGKWLQLPLWVERVLETTSEQRDVSCVNDGPKSP